MFKSYLTIGWRNLLSDTGYSSINISGLAIGMTVAMFIGLWIQDEVSFNKYHKNHDSIAQVWSGGTDPLTGEILGGYALQFPVGATLKNNYPQYFKHVLMAWWISKNTISSAEEKFSKEGVFIDPDALEMLSLKMLKGSYRSLEKQNSIVISRSMAEAIFAKEDPINKVLRIDNRMDVEVTGVFEDIPRNNTFGQVQFFSTWSLWLASNDWVRNAVADWDNRMTNTYVQLQSNTTFEEANAAIHDLLYKSVPKDFFATIEKYKPFVQVVPMNTWHLYSEFENGQPAGGRIIFVWLFGIVGAFVLLLACINFINLSTARSEKRAKEVGIRKTIGSARHQLIVQFMSESFMLVVIAFGLSVLLLASLLPMFNTVAGKDIAMPFAIPAFWFLGVAFIVFTGFMAGIYPAFYLSSFQPVTVLKGVFRFGRSAALPRKILVV
ncbi:MAG TPA: ABC transporter permease, partial [Chryseosolibacter sp.]